VSDDLCGTFGDAETLKGDASALRETRSTVAGCIPQPTAPHKTRGQRIPLPPKLLAVTGLALDHGGYQLDIALRDHGLLLIEMRSCFGPRKTRKDAELEGPVRGRGLLEAGAAEAALGYPVRGVDGRDLGDGRWGQRGCEQFETGLTGVVDFLRSIPGVRRPDSGLLTPGFWRTALQACGGVLGGRVLGRGRRGKTRNRRVEAECCLRLGWRRQQGVVWARAWAGGQWHLFSG
jgi:hypothetical protein